MWSVYADNDPSRPALPDPEAEPGLAPAAAPGLDPVELVVDDESFVVTRRADSPGTYDFEWTSHPASYGFAVGMGVDWKPDQTALIEHIRSFLAEIDPKTGYLCEQADDGESDDEGLEAAGPTCEDPHVEVRAAVVGDADRIAALNAASWRAGFRGLISDTFLTAYDGLPQLRHETLAEPRDDDIQLVALDGEDLVGWVSGGRAQEDDLGPGAFEVRACYVNPDHWRTGVGSRLMDALLDRLEPGRWTHLVLWTVRDAAATNAFYVALGMVRDGREALLDLGGPVPLVRFSAHLEHMRTDPGEVAYLKRRRDQLGANRD